MKSKLKCVVNNSPSALPAERNIVGIIHISGKTKRAPFKQTTRRYLNVDNAVPRLTQLMVVEGKVGDICEIYHAVTGLQIGTIKMTSKGRLATDFPWSD